MNRRSRINSEAFIVDATTASEMQSPPPKTLLIEMRGQGNTGAKTGSSKRRNGKTIMGDKVP